MSHHASLCRRWSGRRAFTLVELLVVIGIIALLITILLPVLGRAREAGNKVACASNLKQWYNTILMYHNDYKSLPGPIAPCSLPFERVRNTAMYNPNPNAVQSSWFRWSTANPDLLMKYFKNSYGVFYCPSNPNLVQYGAPYQGHSSGNVPKNVPLGYSYKFNNQGDTGSPYLFGYWGFVSPQQNYPENRRPKRLNEVRYAEIEVDSSTRLPNGNKQTGKGAAEIWMMSDIDGLNFASDVSSVFGFVDKAIAATKRPYQPPHKSGKPGRNYLFFDGHVSFFLFDDKQPLNTGIDSYALD